MAGRKPTGPPLVWNLEGSEQAKERLLVILETITGKTAIREACDRLGIQDASLYKTRTLALQAAVDRLEPRPMGRPPLRTSPEEKRIAELEKQLREQEVRLKLLETELEIARTVPEMADRAPKKTAKQKRRRVKRKRR